MSRTVPNSNMVVNNAVFGSSCGFDVLDSELFPPAVLFIFWSCHLWVRVNGCSLNVYKEKSLIYSKYKDN